MRSHLILTEQAWPTSKDYIWTCQLINHSWPSEVQPMNFQQKARPRVVNCSQTHLQSFKSDGPCGGIMITGATCMNNSPCTCHSFPKKKNFLLKIFTLRSHSDELSPRATPWEPLPEREIVSLKSWQGLHPITVFSKKSSFYVLTRTHHWRPGQRKPKQRLVIWITSWFFMSVTDIVGGAYRSQPVYA